MAGLRKDRVWIAGGVVAAVVIAAAGWLLLVSPEFGAASDSEQQLADAQTQNIVQQKRLDTLREKASHTDDLTAELQSIYAAVPPDHDVQGFTRQLTGFAKDAGVTITSISPGQPTPVALPSETTPSSDAAAGGSAAATGTTTSDTSTTEAAPTTAVGPAGNVYSISVSVASSGPMSAQQKFLSAIEKQGDRRALVTSTVFVPIVEAAEQNPVDTSGAAAGSTAAGTSETGVSTTTTAGVPTTLPPPPPASATDGRWTLTTQLLIFVAPQSPDQEAQLLDQLGGNG